MMKKWCILISVFFLILLAHIVAQEVQPADSAERSTLNHTPAKTAHFVSFHVSPEGDLHILYSDGTEIRLQKEHGVPYDYDEDEFFKEHYSHTLKVHPVFPNGTPLLPSVTSKSPSGFASAVLTQTDPIKIPYDDETAYIEVTGEQFAPLYIEVKNFRGVELSWATDRILIIRRDIGHIAGMEEVIDIVDRRWLFQKAFHFNPE